MLLQIICYFLCDFFVAINVAWRLNVLVRKTFITDSTLYNQEFSNFYIFVQNSTTTAEHNFGSTTGCKYFEITGTGRTSYVAQGYQNIRLIFKAVNINRIFSAKIAFKFQFSVFLQIINYIRKESDNQLIGRKRFKVPLEGIYNSVFVIIKFHNWKFIFIYHSFLLNLIYFSDISR